MRVLAEGCDRCEPQVAPKGDREGPNHFSVRFGISDWAATVLIDGEVVTDVSEAWAGTPGRVIRFGTEPRRCWDDVPNPDGSLVGPGGGWWRQLIEYDNVEVRL